MNSLLRKSKNYYYSQHKLLKKIWKLITGWKGVINEHKIGITKWFISIDRIGQSRNNLSWEVIYCDISYILDSIPLDLFDRLSILTIVLSTMSVSYECRNTAIVLTMNFKWDEFKQQHWRMIFEEDEWVIFRMKRNSIWSRGEHKLNHKSN